MSYLIYICAKANQERHEAAFAGKTSASWKRGENVENRYTWARFAQNIPRDQRICAAELGSEVCARMVRISTAPNIYTTTTTDNSTCILSFTYHKYCCALHPAYYTVYVYTKLAFVVIQHFCVFVPGEGELQWS